MTDATPTASPPTSLPFHLAARKERTDKNNAKTVRPKWLRKKGAVEAHGAEPV
jgi:hypothetical protein